VLSLCASRVSVVVRLMCCLYVPHESALLLGTVGVKHKVNNIDNRSVFPFKP
jgi:hypothetical protein